MVVRHLDTIKGAFHGVVQSDKNKSLVIALDEEEKVSQKRRKDMVDLSSIIIIIHPHFFASNNNINTSPFLAL